MGTQITPISHSQTFLQILFPSPPICAEVHPHLRPLKKFYTISTGCY